MIAQFEVGKTYETTVSNFYVDCGLVDTSARWPMNCIDWEQAARELQMDYSNILIHGSTYWYR